MKAKYELWLRDQLVEIRKFQQRFLPEGFKRGGHSDSSPEGLWDRQAAYCEGFQFNFSQVVEMVTADLGWQPMETAPKDVAILGWTEDCVDFLVESMRWRTKTERWYSESTGRRMSPTQWMCPPKEKL